MPSEELEVWITIAVWSQDSGFCRIVNGLQRRGDHRSVDDRWKIRSRMRSVIAAGELQNVSGLNVTVCIDIREPPGLSGRRQDKILPGNSARLFAHGKTAKKEQLVFQDWATHAPAEVVQNNFIPWHTIGGRTLGIVAPTIRIQRGISQIFVGAAVIGICPPAGDEVDLHVGLTVS